MAPPKCVKSTITVTPTVSLHADAAAPRRGADTAIAQNAIAAPAAAATGLLSTA
jgi:hypothetical protein